MRNGRVVGEAVGSPDEAVGSPGEPEATRPKAEGSQAPVITGKRRQLPWREQLPGLDGTGSSDEPEGNRRESGVIIESRSEPAPQPEPAFEMWEDDSSARREPSNNDDSRGPVQMLVPPKEQGARGEASSLAGSFNSAVGNYTVQLAAFDRKADAEKFIAGARWRQVELEVSQFVRDGRPLFIVTFGRFASPREAITAWGVQDPSGEQDIWVREIAR